MNISNRTILRIMVMIAVFSATLRLAWLAHTQLTWLAAAFFLAIALNPAVEWLSSKMPKNSRGLAAGTVFAVTIAAITLMLSLLIPPLVRQTQLLVRDLPGYVEQAASPGSPVGELVRKYNVVDRIKAEQKQVISELSKASGSLVDVLKTVFSSVAATITVLVLTFFMLVEGPAWAELLWEAQPTSKQRHRKQMAHQMYKTVTGYVNGNLFISLVAGVATALALTIIGIPFAIPLGLAVAVFDLLPLVGATIGSIAVISVCLFQSLTAAIIMLIFFVVYQQLENHILQPVVYGRTVKMSPLLVLVSVLLGAALAGFLGALVAIPVAGSLQILVKDYFITHRPRT